MIADCIKLRLSEFKLTPGELAEKMELPVEAIEGLLQGLHPIPTEEVAKVLQFFGGEFAPSTENERWRQGLFGERRAGDSLHLLICGPGTLPASKIQLPQGPLQFILQRLDHTNIDPTRELIARALEHYEPRILISEVEIREVEEKWHIGITWINLPHNTRENMVTPYPITRNSELPEVGRRRK
jgi:hypothetical protein